jgi:hypothetical protein
MNAFDACAVALRDPAAAPLAPAGFLAARGYGKDAARTLMRSQPGFLGRALTLEAARELAGAASAAGLETLLVREADIPAPLPAIKVLKLEPGAGGFTVQAGGALKEIPYASVSLIAAAAFDAPAPRPSLEALERSLFVKLMRLAGAETPAPATDLGPMETFFRADLIAEDGALRLLLEPENMDFSPLGPGRSHSSLVNFRALLAALAASCAGAVQNAFLVAFLANRPLAPYKLASAEACETSLSRLLLAASRRAG